MSAREWKPGDVAMVKVKKAWHRAIRDHVAWVVITDDVHADHLETCADVDYDARPLVVIDPEDREQVERLDAAIRAAYGNCDVLDPDKIAPMQAALRSLIEPPKCAAALNIKGAHYGCDGRAGHGLAHSNEAVGAIWSDQP